MSTSLVWIKNGIYMPFHHDTDTRTTNAVLRGERDVSTILTKVTEGCYFCLSEYDIKDIKNEIITMFEAGFRLTDM